jgi:hypothetical protein
MEQQKIKTSTLDDGTIITRAFEDDNLEARRLEAINKMGTRWIMHPANFKQRIESTRPILSCN